MSGVSSPGAITAKSNFSSALLYGSFPGLRHYVGTWEIAVGLLFGIAFGAFFRLGYFGALENNTIDRRFRTRGGLEKCRGIVLVAITDPCVKNLGTWPWPRKIHASLLEKIKNDGASIVAFDLMFNEPSIAGADDDKIFAEVLRKAGNVILPVAIQKKLVLDNETFEMVERHVPEYPINVLKEACLDFGFIDMEHQLMNSDGVIRHVFLEKTVNSSNFHIFGLAALKHHLNKPVERLPGGFKVGDSFLPYYSRKERFAEVPKVESYMINYSGPTGSFDEIPYQTVLENNFPKGFFKNKIVIVGTRAMGISEDLKFGPFGALPGMEIHANLVHNALTKETLMRFSPGVVATGILLFSILLSCMLSALKGIPGNMFTLLVWGGYLLSGNLMFRVGIITEMVPLLILIPIQWATIRLLQQFYDLRQRNIELAKKVKELTTVNEVSQAVSFMGDLSKTLDTILSRAVQALDAERGSLFMLDEKYESLVESSVFFGIEGEASLSPELKAKFKTGEGIAGEVFARGKPRLIRDISKEKDFAVVAEREHALRSLVCVPLSVRDNPIGVMNIVNKSFGCFEAEDLELALTLANQAAVVIEKARLFNLATIDGLTGLIVHRHFQAKIEEEFRRAKRYDKPLALLMTDIDHFKKFNDTWGHQTGDQVLREVAKCANASIRDTDIAARYGGEEFSIILPETDLEGGMLFAERLRQRVESMSFQGPSGMLQVTISLGLSSIPYNKAESSQEMIKLADEALYSAKRSGRNKVGVSECCAAEPES